MKRILGRLRQAPGAVWAAAAVLAVLAAFALGYWVASAQREKAFLEKTRHELENILYATDQMLGSSGPDDCRTASVRLGEAIQCLEANMEAGSRYVSDKIPGAPLLENGFPAVRQALEGELGAGYAAQPIWADGLDAGETAFLTVFRAAAARLRDMLDGPDVLFAFPRLNKYLEAYDAFEQQWWKDARRTPDGTSPFGLLQQTETDRT